MAGLLAVLVRTVASIERSVDGLLVVRDPGGRATPRTSRSSRPPRRSLELIVQEAVVQDGYMNALTDGFGQQ